MSGISAARGYNSASASYALFYNLQSRPMSLSKAEQAEGVSSRQIAGSQAVPQREAGAFSGIQLEPFRAPFIRQGADPVEMAVKSRIQYLDQEDQCQTCEERKYQDVSNDSGVSFQTPSHVAPEQAAYVVRGHEQEHVVREQAKAQEEDRKVISQSVTLSTSICPECGRTYISGGNTRTVTKADNKSEMFSQPAPDQPRFEAVA